MFVNGFNYDYMDYLNNMPNTFIPDTNYNNISFLLPNSTDSNTTEPYIGFIRGNLYDNLYEPYKNYNAKELNPHNEKEAILLQLLQYNFALIELNLYLDIYSNDNKALALYNNYLNIKKQLEEKFESSYGPIDVCSNFIGKNSWNWDNGPWPWEVIK